jgi:hypothetical protein
MPDSISLAGTWSFALDPKDEGLTHSWGTRALADPIALPGSVQERGFGELPTRRSPWTGEFETRFLEWEAMHPDIPMQVGDRFRSPYFLTPQRVYVGAAWFSREIEIPASWAGQRVTLFLERAHWDTTVLLDGAKVGAGNALCAPHEHVLFESAVAGKHRLTIRVDNRVHEVNPGQNSHSISDHTQGNWNGLAGALELHVTPTVYIHDVRVYPSVASRTARLVVDVSNARTTPANVTLSANDASFALSAPPGLSTSELTVKFPAEAPLWDEFNPALNDVTLRLTDGTACHERALRIGLRELGRNQHHVLLNGQPIFLRGTLECCIFPLTGYPPTDINSWKRVINTCKAHGLNHMRFHSYCPPAAAFHAADELGFYLQVECSSWANQGATVGDGHPLDKWLYEEADRILRAFGNHPSFVFFLYGNEPDGKHMNEYLTAFIEHYRKADGRHLYTSGAGWPMLPATDYHSTSSPRLHQWGDGNKSRLNATAPETTSDYAAFVAKHADKPILSHEIGQWCVFPNLAERGKYTGNLQARNFDLFAEVLEKSHQLDLAPEFLQASGKLQALCYKEEVEAALRTEGFGGFQLLDLHDFPGQGTALVGTLDPFWDEKGYIAAAEYRRFAGPIVPLARLGKRTFVSGETLAAKLELSHFGPADLANVEVRWSVKSPAATLATGSFTVAALPKGGLRVLKEIAVPLIADVATSLELEVAIPAIAVSNSWGVWVFPAAVSDARSGVIVTADAAEAIASVSAGKSVLLTLTPDRVRAPRTGEPSLELGFTPVFWNTAWTTRQAPHTLGLLVREAHPALAGFPTSSHVDWQWWDLIHHARPMILTDLPPDLRPVVHVIDDWFTSRRLGLVFEAKVGAGKLLVTSIDLTTDLADRPAARQLRASLLTYAGSTKFSPSVDITEKQLCSVLA